MTDVISTREIVRAGWGLVCNACHHPKTAHRAIPTIVFAGCAAVWNVLVKPWVADKITRVKRAVQPRKAASTSTRRRKSMLAGLLLRAKAKAFELSLVAGAILAVSVVLFAMFKANERLAAEAAVLRERNAQWASAQHSQQQGLVEAARQRAMTGTMSSAEVDKELSRSGSFRADVAPHTKTHVAADPYVEPQRFAEVFTELDAHVLPASGDRPAAEKQVPKQQAKARKRSQPTAKPKQPAGNEAKYDWPVVTIVTGATQYRWSVR